MTQQHLPGASIHIYLLQAGAVFPCEGCANGAQLRAEITLVSKHQGSVWCGFRLSSYSLAPCLCTLYDTLDNYASGRQRGTVHFHSPLTRQKPSTSLSRQPASFCPALSHCVLHLLVQELLISGQQLCSTLLPRFRPSIACQSCLLSPPSFDLDLPDPDRRPSYERTSPSVLGPSYTLPHFAVVKSNLSGSPGTSSHIFDLDLVLGTQPKPDQSLLSSAGPGRW